MGYYTKSLAASKDTLAFLRKQRDNLKEQNKELNEEIKALEEEIEALKKNPEPAKLPKSTSNPKQRFCIHCGAKLLSEAQFCGECGKAVPK